MNILTEDALIDIFKWFGGKLKAKLKRPDLEFRVESFPNYDGGATLYLFPPSWRLPGLPEEFVAYSLEWENCYQTPFHYEVYLPPAGRFPEKFRDKLAGLIRKPLQDAGFIGDADGPKRSIFWKPVPGSKLDTLAIHKEEILEAIIKGKGFEDMMKVEKLIDKTLSQMPVLTPICQRTLTPIAVLDTEWKIKEPRGGVTELAIKIVEYDSLEDRIAGISGQYVKNKNSKLDKQRAYGLLNRAQWIVAHNGGGDRSRLARELPGIPKSKWLDSCHGIAWKSLLGTGCKAQNELLRALGLDNKTQIHSAEVDVDDLIRILAEKDSSGRTYLSRLLETAR
jgi:hypothetical protein